MGRDTTREDVESAVALQEAIQTSQSDNGDPEAATTCPEGEMMKLSDSLAFSEEIRKRVGEKTREMMDRITEMIGYGHRTVAKFDHNFDLDPKGDLRHLHNQYIDAIFASFMLRNVILNSSIINAINRYDFLTYALAGRSLIEIAATLRYYLGKKIKPIVEMANTSRLVNNESLRQLIDHEDRLLRGSRFDWDIFFAEGFDALAADYRDWLKRKKKEGHRAKRWEARPLECEQINTATCLESWAQDDPRVGVLYDLFCDMVHPNVGSTLCIATCEETGIKFSVDQQNSFGLTLFDRSYAPLQAYVAKEFGANVMTIVCLKFADDELD